MIPAMSQFGFISTPLVSQADDTDTEGDEELSPEEEEGEDEDLKTDDADEL